MAGLEKLSLRTVHITVIEDFRYASDHATARAQRFHQAPHIPVEVLYHAVASQLASGSFAPNHRGNIRSELDSFGRVAPHPLG